jgi:hypothetical protein
MQQYQIIKNISEVGEYLSDSKFLLKRSKKLS